MARYKSFEEAGKAQKIDELEHLFKFVYHVGVSQKDEVQSKETKAVNVGDLFWISFIDNHNKRVENQPFIVIQKLKKQLQIIDAKSILAIGENALLKPISQLKSLLENVIKEKELLSQIDIYYLFSEDLQAKDISKMFSESKTKEIVRIFIDLMAEDKVFINKNNLSPVKIVEEQ